MTLSADPPAGSLAGLLTRFRTGPLARGAVLNLVITGFGTGISFLVQMLLARKLGAHEFGLYAYAMGWLALALLPAKLDFDSAATRFVGAYSGNGEWRLLNGFVKRGAQVVLLASIVVGCVAAIGMLGWRSYQNLPVEPLFWAACALLPLTALMMYMANVLQGFRRVPAAQLPTLVIRPLLFGIGALSVAMLSATALTATTALLLNLAATVVVLSVQWRFIARARAAHPDTPRYELKEWFGTALGLLSVSVAQMILSGQTDIVVVGTLLSKSAAGHYAIASQIANTLLMGTTAIAFVAAPTIALYHRAGQRDALQRLINRVRLANLALTIPALLIIAVVGRPLLGLFGPGFKDAFPVLLVLSASGLQAAAGGSIAGFLVTMTGNERAGAGIIGTAAIAYLVLVVILAPLYGAVGVALATFTAYLFRAIWLGVYVRRKLGVSVWFSGHVATAVAPGS
jgi:O-antigen/teichoic acid export membrane protein